MAALTTIFSTSKKRYVHLRDLTFQPCSLKCMVGDVIVFIHDGNVEDTHSLCIPEVSNSPALHRGDRWEYQILADELPADSNIVVIDSLLSFMKLIIRVRVPNTKPSSQIKSPTTATEKFADSFVYAAANNQITIVRRRLGLDESTGKQRDMSTSEHSLPIMASINAVDSDGFTALGAAARSGFVDIVALLLEQGAVVDFANKGGNTALHLAANWGKSEVVMLLLRHGASVHALNECSRTPLHLATFNGHHIAVDMILKFGEPDPHMTDSSGKTPLEIAVDFGTSRLEIAYSIKVYAEKIYAPNITSIMVSVERQPSMNTHNESKVSSISPFQYLYQLNTGALSLISRFLACPEIKAIAELEATEKRLGLKSRGMTSTASSNARFAVFSPLKKFDPRSRSLPYLLRQAEEREAQLEGAERE